MTQAAVITLAIMSGLALAGLFAWVVYQLLPEKGILLDRTIVKKYRGKTQRMPLTGLSEIKFRSRFRWGVGIYGRERELPTSAEEVASWFPAELRPDETWEGFVDQAYEPYQVPKGTKPIACWWD
jgi:hypothetical protein